MERSTISGPALSKPGNTPRAVTGLRAGGIYFRKPFVLSAQVLPGWFGPARLREVRMVRANTAPWEFPVRMSFIEGRIDYVTRQEGGARPPRARDSRLPRFAREKNIATQKCL